MTMLQLLELIGKVAMLAAVTHEVTMLTQAVFAAGASGASPFERSTLLLRKFALSSLLLGDLAKAVLRVPNFGALRASSGLVGLFASAPLLLTGAATPWGIGGVFAVTFVATFGSAHFWLEKHSARYRHALQVHAKLTT